MRRHRLALVLVPAALVLLVSATPLAAYYETLNKDTTAVYQVSDAGYGPGATCIYENNSGQLNDEIDRIRIKKFFAHGPFSGDSYVGARYVIRRDAPPFGDGYSAFYTSPIVKKLANDAEVAYFGPWTWTAPEGTNAHWQVVLKLYWYSKASPSTVIGRAQGRIEVYKHKLYGTTTTYQEGGEGSGWYCEKEFWPIPA